MLPVIVISVAVVFIIIWKMGFLDELKERGQARDMHREYREPEQLEAGSVDPEMKRRLEVFKDFMDEFSNEDEE
ncbi:MAG: hypothetical protein GTO18_06230 [Anaerolineales bacterium]|nr:hypothetical protein [Anaerolineales bacterium]